MANIKFNVGFNVDKSSLTQIKKELSDINTQIKKQGADSGLTKEMKEALHYTNLVDQALKKASNNKLNKINTEVLNKELKKAGVTLADVDAKLRMAGVNGSSAFQSINRELRSTGVQAKQTSKILDDMFDTFGKTVKWGIASSMMNQFTGSVRQALGFTKALDSSLNQIRIVTGKSADEMDVFAEQANKAAKELGKTTTEYTDASLLFFQQGKNAAEVQELTRATLMGANITGTEVSAMADMLTSALNGYSMSADKAIYVTDTLAAIGAATGSDFEELAVGMSKVASQAATVGVPFEKLNAMLATISETTREAPETIGTSLKTVFARMSEIKLEGSATDEDGVTMTLGKVQDALSLIDVSLTDATGGMRDMGDVIEDIGEKWEGTDVATKSAITNAMAGQRQASRLMALFNQWDRYEVALAEAMDATGATMEQNEIAMDSMAYKSKQLRAEIERLWMNLIDSDFLKGAVDGLANMFKKVNDLSETLGGMKSIVTSLGGIILTVFGKQISRVLRDLGAGLNNIKNGFLSITGAATPKEKAKAQEAKKEKKVLSGLTPQDQQKYQAEKEKLADLQHEVDVNKKLLALQKERIQNSQELVTLGNQIAKETDVDLNTKVEFQRTRSLDEAFEIQQKMEISGKSYKQTMEELTAEERERLGVTKEALMAVDNMEDLIKNIKGAASTDKDFFGGSLDKAIKDADKLQLEINEIEKELKETTTAAKQTGEALAGLNQRVTTQKGKVNVFEKMGLSQARVQSIVKGVGLATTAINTLGPTLKLMGDETATVTEKSDAWISSLLMLAPTLMMIGGPIGLIAGAVALLGAGFAKLVKESQVYEKAVKQNEKAIERYKNRTSELTDEIKTLESQKSSLAEMDRELALVGGDLNKLTAEQQEAYKNLRNEIAQTTPEMVAYYDAEGNAVLKANQSLDDYLEQKKKALQLERETMVENRENFVTQYSQDIQNGEAKIAALSEKEKRLKKELEGLKDSGASQKNITKKQTELSTVQGDLSEIKTSLQDVSTNIQKNMIEPFMLANEELQKVPDSMKQISSGIYDLETVQGIINKFEFKIEMDKVTGEIKKVKRPAEEMSTMVNRELDKVEEKSVVVAKALNKIFAGTGIEGKAGEEFRKLQGLIEGADQAAQDYMGSIASMALTADGASKIIGGLAKSIDQFGIVKPIDYDELLPILSEDVDTRISEVKSELNELNKAYEKAKQEYADVPDKIAITGTDRAYLQSQGMGPQISQEQIDAEQKIEDIERKTADVLTKQKDLEAEKQRLVDESIRKQQELNWEHQKYLMGIASTPEGMNKIIASYNEQYSQLEEINRLMNEGRTETQTVEGEVDPETGKMGEPIKVEVQRFEDSELGTFFYEFESRIESIRDEVLPSFGEGLRDVLSRAGEGTDAINSVYDDMAEKLSTIPDGALEKISGLNKEIVAEAKGGTQEAIDQVVKSVNKQQQSLGRMYATINKDSTSYYQDFAKQNKKQMQLVGLATGVMGDDYATYAQYTADLDKWMADNSAWLADSEVSNMYWSAMEGINAKLEQGQKTEIINGEMVTSAYTYADAAADASAAASYAAVVAEAKASKDKAQMTIDALNSIELGTAGLSPDLANAAQGVLQDRKAQAEVDLAFYDQLIAQAEAKLAEAGGTTVTEAKRPPTGGLGDFNYSTGGGNVKPVPTSPTKPTGSNGTDLNGGAGDSGGGSGDKEKEVEDLEWEEDIYHDINIQLEKKQQLLDKLQRQQDKLYGKELLDNLAKQRQALEEQQKLLEKKLEMQKQDMKNQQELLKKQGVQFNVDGTIANYNQLLKEKLAYVNSLSGEAKEAAKEEFSALEEMMQKYEELIMNSINETENAIQDSIDAQREIWIQEFEYTIRVQIELTDDFQKALGFQKEMADDFEDASENYERTLAQLGNRFGEIQAIQEQIQKIENDTSLTEKERIEMLAEWSEKLKESVKDAKALREELTKITEEALKDGLDMIKEHLDGYKAIDNQIKHIQSMVKLLGKEGDFDFLDQLYQEQYDNIQGQLDVLLAQKESLKAQRDTFEVGSEEWKMFNDELTKTEEQINKLTQEALKVLQDEFKNSINAIMKDLDEALSGGLGLKELREDFKELNDKRKEYLDIEEKITETGKLQKKLQDAMKNTTDPKQLAILQKFKDTELAQLKEKDKLTQYDVDRANQLYELTLKQMALDEQRNAKNMMRLIRDASGNWVYEFVEDAEAVAKAQEEMSKDLEKLQEMDKKQFEKTQEDMLKAKEDYMKKIQDIINKQMKGEYESEEAFRAALEEEQQKFNDRMQELGDRLNEAQLNGVTSSLATILQAYLENDEALGLLSEEQEAMMEQLATAVGGDFFALSELMKALNGENLEDFYAMAEGMGLNGEELKGALEAITGDIREDWGGNITDMIGDIGNLGTDTALTVEQIMAKWEEYQTKVEETTGKTNNDYDSLKDKLDEVSTATDYLNEKTDGLIGKFDEEMTQLSNVIGKFNEMKTAYDDNIKKATDYIAKLDELIRKQKEQATGVNTPGAPAPPSGSTSGSTSGSNSGSSTTTKPPTTSSSSSSTAGKPTKGKQVKVKNSSALAWYDSSNNRPVPNWSSQAKAVGISWDAPVWSVNQANGKMALSKTNNISGALSWVKESDLVGLRSGGYTGKFQDPNQGKLAVLHEKELVLNKQDTANMLKAVSMVRGEGNLGQMLRASIMQGTDRIVGAISRLGSGMKASGADLNSIKQSKEQDIKQSVQINADFSGVKNSGEIEKAFNSLAIQASQYASKKK